MAEKALKILTKEQMNLEIQLLINRRLHERNIIDKATYETVMNELLKDIQAIKIT